MRKKGMVEDVLIGGWRFAYPPTVLRSRAERGNEEMLIQRFGENPVDYQGHHVVLLR